MWNFPHPASKLAFHSITYFPPSVSHKLKPEWWNWKQLFCLRRKFVLTDTVTKLECLASDQGRPRVWIVSSAEIQIYSSPRDTQSGSFSVRKNIILVCEHTLKTEHLISWSFDQTPVVWSTDQVLSFDHTWVVGEQQCAATTGKRQTDRRRHRLSSPLAPDPRTPPVTLLKRPCFSPEFFGFRSYGNSNLSSQRDFVLSSSNVRLVRREIGGRGWGRMRWPGGRVWPPGSSSLRRPTTTTTTRRKTTTTTTVTAEASVLGGLPMGLDRPAGN